MTKDEIIRMAREAGFEGMTDHPALMRFAHLIAAHKTEVITAEAYRCGVLAGAEAEREECAKVCEAGINNATDWDNNYWNQCCENRAAAIRARIDK